MAQAILTVDLGFGDAGKGSIVDFLTRAHAAHTVVRYNGGAQAGHRVVTPGPSSREHVFAQFGSGTLAGADTHLSRFMLLEPLAMAEEEKHLRTLGVTDGFERTTIDERALVITPFQRAVNRLRELARGDGRHGSCGMGVGEAMADFLEYGDRVLQAGDLLRPDVLFAKLNFVRSINLAKLGPLRSRLQDVAQASMEMEPLVDATYLTWIMEEYRDFVGRARIVSGEILRTVLERPGVVVFEGAQGVLLDEWAGFHPYTTWSTTTLANADCLLAEAGHHGSVERVGITRAYATRHGAGPFVTEDAELTEALPDACNTYGAWQQGFRIGWLDLVMLRYALEIVGRLDYLAVTCLDRLAGLPTLQLCSHYDRDGAAVERIAPAPTGRDLAYQAQLTQELAHCRPRLEVVHTVEAMLQRLERELGRPVGLISEGVTATEKQFLMPLAGVCPAETFCVGEATSTALSLCETGAGISL